MKTIHDFLKGKNILVFGLGVQGGGVGDLLWLKEHGYAVRGTDSAQLNVPELSGVTLTLGSHSMKDITWADLIIKNPGVPEDAPMIVEAEKLGKKIYSSIALFVKYCPIKTIGITGTRGKSTTTALTAKTLESVYPEQIVTGGNIPGTSGFALFDQLAHAKYVVLELSSFQLHSFHALKVSPNYSLLTNIYPDHLNRYPDMETYVSDKKAIYLYQKPGDFHVEYPEASLVADWDTPLPGLHNRANIAGMWRLVSRLGVNEAQARRVVASFKGIPFRQEKIAEIGGVAYINDTTATTPVAATVALQAQSQPTVLICGGASKNLPVEVFLNEIKNNVHVKKIIILGSQSIPEFTEPLFSFARSKIIAQVNSMPEAVQLAHAHAVTGDVVLLSPGFSSFDLFQNEFDRGRQFNDSVHALRTL